MDVKPPHPFHLPQTRYPERESTARRIEISPLAQNLKSSCKVHGNTQAQLSSSSVRVVVPSKRARVAMVPRARRARDAVVVCYFFDLALLYIFLLWLKNLCDFISKQFVGHLGILKRPVIIFTKLGF